MLTWTMVQKKAVSHIINPTFPEYRGRKIRVAAATSVTLRDLNWSGGTKSEYKVVRLTDNASLSLTNLGNLAPWENPYEGATISIVPNMVVVEHSIFCGKDTGIRIYAHPDNFPKLLSN
jgi:hypothetical protein